MTRTGRREFCLPLLAAAVLACPSPLAPRNPAAAAPAQSIAGTVSSEAHSPRFHLAVVTDGNATSSNVHVVDTHTLGVVQTIALPGGGSSFGYQIALTASGRYAYGLSYKLGKSSLIQVDLFTLTAVNLGELNPLLGIPSTTFVLYEDLEISPDDRYVVIPFGSSSFPPWGGVALFDAASGAFLHKVTLCTGSQCGSGSQVPHTAPIAFSPDGRLLYVPVYDGGVPGGVRIVDLSAAVPSVVHEMPLFGPPGSIFASDLEAGPSSTLFALRNTACSGAPCTAIRRYDLLQDSFVDLGSIQSPPVANELEVVALQGRTLLALADHSYGEYANLTVIDADTGATTLIPGSDATFLLAYDAPRKELWTLCPPSSLFGSHCIGGQVDVYDMQTATKVASMTASMTNLTPTHAAISQDGRRLFLTDYAVAGKVIVFDTATKQQITTFPVGKNPAGIYMQGDNATK